MFWRQWLALIFLVLLNCLVWGLLIEFLPPALVSPPRQVAELSFATEERSAPTFAPTSMPRRGATPTATPTSTLTPQRTELPTWTPIATQTSTTKPSLQLPALYVDGAYIRRSDTRAPVWLKGVNIEEFRQRNPHTFANLYTSQGLGIVIGQRWGINLLRVAVDPETIGSNFSEYDKLITFAEQNGMYIILTPFASAVNPSRDEQRMVVPDDLVATAMGRLADKYKDRTNVFYALWNEPHPESSPSAGYDTQWQVWMESATSVAKSIRSKNPKSILVVPGGTKWGRDLSFYKEHPFPFGNIIYDVHDYWASPDYNYNRDIWTWVIGKYPLLIGEFGGNPINPTDPSSVIYMKETLQIVNQNPGTVHYAMYVLTRDGAWGIFTRGMSRMPRGNLLLDDLSRYPPTRFR